MESYLCFMNVCSLQDFYNCDFVVTCNIISVSIKASEMVIVIRMNASLYFEKNVALMAQPFVQVDSMLVNLHFFWTE